MFTHDFRHIKLAGKIIRNKTYLAIVRILPLAVD